MKPLCAILLAMSAAVVLAVGPALTRTIELTITVAQADQSTNNTLHVQSSTNLADWLTITNVPATTNRIQLQVVPQQMFFRSFLSNAWTVSEFSEPSMLPAPLSGERPVQIVSVLPLTK